MCGCCAEAGSDHPLLPISYLKNPLRASCELVATRINLHLRRIFSVLLRGKNKQTSRIVKKAKQMSEHLLQFVFEAGWVLDVSLRWRASIGLPLWQEFSHWQPYLPASTQSSGRRYFFERWHPLHCYMTSGENLEVMEGSPRNPWKQYREIRVSGDSESYPP